MYNIDILFCEHVLNYDYTNFFFFAFFFDNYYQNLLKIHSFYSPSLHEFF